MHKRDIIAAARLDAHRFLRGYGVRSRADLRPEAWAYDRGVEIIEDDLDGAEAQLTRFADRAQIILPSRVTDPTVRRFGIVHELDHLIHEHPSPTPTMLCKPKALRRDHGKLRRFEIEANAFAGAVLLPDFLVRHRCEVSPVSLDVAYQLGKEFDVSILASAIRFVELASERCAVVFSKDAVVKWAVHSPTFTRKIARGRRLDPDSVAYDYHATGTLDERAQPVPADAWLRTRASVDIVEHSICHPAYRTVLSLLWVPDSVADVLGMS